MSKSVSDFHAHVQGGRFDRDRISAVAMLTAAEGSGTGRSHHHSHDARRDARSEPKIVSIGHHTALECQLECSTSMARAHGSGSVSATSRRHCRSMSRLVATFSREAIGTSVMRLAATHALPPRASQSATGRPRHVEISV